MFINTITKVIIAAYVDDLLFIARNRDLITQIKKELDKRFNFKYMGDLKDYLGINVVRNLDNCSIQVNQTKYINQLLKQLGMEKCSPAKSPMEQANIAVAPDGYTASSSEREAYQSLMGALNWLSVMTRPDITYAVSNLSRSLNNPTPQHMNAAKRVLRYLSGTVDDGLIYQPGKNDGLEGFTDASYCDDYETSRSTGAYVYKLFNGPVAWQSKLQKLVATSTCESEYIAAAEACKEALYLGPMLEELGYDEGAAPVLLSIDNQAAMKLATNPINHTATKHIRMRYHLVRQLVSETKEIRLQWVDTKGQCTDPLTKPIGPINFGLARQQLGLAPSEV